MANFKMNPNFGNDLMRQINPQIQKMFDSVYNQHADQPVEDVKVALRSQASRMGMTLDDDAKLTELATAISNGIRLKIRGA